jgi:single-strand DNA-binding protein
MPQFQQVTVIGHLGQDPETKYLSNGDAITNFSVAVGEQWIDKASGQKKEHTEWFRCNAFKKLAEVAGKYLKKGEPVFIQGRLKTRKWQDKEGQDRYSTELQVERIQLLGKRGEGADEQSSEPHTQRPRETMTDNKADVRSDVPFSPIRKLEAMLA